MFLVDILLQSIAVILLMELQVSNQDSIKKIFVLMKKRAKILYKKKKINNDVFVIEEKINNRLKELVELNDTCIQDLKIIGMELSRLKSKNIVDVINPDERKNLLENFPLHYLGILLISKSGELGRDYYRIQYYIWLLLTKKDCLLNYYGDIANDIKIAEKLSDKSNIKKIAYLYSVVLIKHLVFHYLNIKFNNDYERKVAHYTSIEVATKLLKKQTKFRLNTLQFVNDPSEGRILFDFLKFKYSDVGNNKNLHYAGCFTFNHNSLNQFRLYGNTDNVECSGVSLTVNKEFFLDENQEYNIYRCIYLDPNTGYLKIASRNSLSFYQEYIDSAKEEIKKFSKKYFLKIKNKENKLNDLISLLKKIINKHNSVDSIVIEILEPLPLLVKHIAFVDEDECRVFSHDHNLSDVRYSSVNNTSYLEYTLDMRDSIKNIYVGSSASELETFIMLVVENEKWGKCPPKVKVNDSPFRTHKIINRISGVDITENFFEK